MNTFEERKLLSLSHRPRRYDLDWLRIIAIVILLYYHVGMIYVRWDWHINHPESSPLLEVMMAFLHQWRMPLLFLISGIGTYFALGFRSAGKYTRERSKRLFFPVVFGIFVIVPPQIYLERIFKQEYGSASFNSYWDYYPRVFEFVIYPQGDFSWHHLWFVVYLFVYSLLCLPLFLYLRSEGGQTVLQRFERWMCVKGGALYTVIPVLLIQWMLKPIFPEETHALYNDWAYFTYNLLFFVFGYIIGDRRNIWEAFVKQRYLFLTASMLAVMAMYAVYFTPAEHWPLPAMPLGFRYWWLTTTLVAWFTVLTILAFGCKYLNHNHPWLGRLNEGIYPFYILHQTVIIIIAFQVEKWDWGIWSGFWFVSTLSFLLCVGIYQWGIRPFAVTRFLFGMKPASVKKKSEYYKKSIAKV